MKFVQLTLGLLIANLFAPSLPAADRIVWGFEFISGVVDGNLIVLPGGSAVLSGAIVQGSAVIHPGGAMTSNHLTSMIHGDVAANGAETIALFQDIVGGNVAIAKSGNVYLYDSYIGRDVNLRGNDVMPWIVVMMSDIRGSVNLFNNTSAFDILVLSNVIRRNLYCAGNTPPAQITSQIHANNKVGGKIRCEDIPLQLTSFQP